MHKELNQAGQSTPITSVSWCPERKPGSLDCFVLYISKRNLSLSSLVSSAVILLLKAVSLPSLLTTMI